ncbi:1-(5-phosphoribosyl)-5-((5-phosphoribosylamino)methylideneamino) imidazole-4-carboxamide isomerase [Ferrimonas balearica DSM 9799]|uniref:1-(5-phosphoribosyl)-5-[(5-phosphoribosylamino)methylideneamino] imidazole-4-carboxamide isomerase n=1 Tax=Ferrimonas balearica (strain DSM 9799 / CCM 4581 / KCTC 23876 / PAT) TaxID=550540 RepID=E1SRG1_FERBD|nr:1-(5-phosphoribosyl)-5-[(5-phosphoribosylamino)methylideneamino]imidazole-4-carboxamide isomerase [Ferrimonas balearica]ADN75912.1 1-(5-phosphoribosyl)-5-((5-phosphoribosylamino)methylideneamino) imidazole-4-carboxamide isomerase [Ferrimonas balearica DSM 9799]MBW3138803.1 1-(5-phosphoribosyl)-5-[(5-phosphoribosylamino)methylideneamino]imidazole-4-carboxamide isomerase [Ferrimonas balearica]
MIIPAIDLINGNVVRLEKGDFNAVTRFQLDPLEQLRAYQDAGSALLHLVDLDGAKDPANRQLDTIARLVSQLDAPIQVGGGVRSQADVDALLDIGVAKVVVGSLSVSQPDTVAGWLRQYGPDRITVALDVRLDDDGQPEVLTHGWQKGSGKALADVIAPLLEAGLSDVLCTDVDRDGMLSGPNVALYQQLVTRYPTVRWQASGGIAQLSDLAELKAINIGGIIIGKALLAGRFTIEEALACWQNG